MVNVLEDIVGKRANLSIGCQYIITANVTLLVKSYGVSFTLHLPFPIPKHRPNWNRTDLNRTKIIDIRNLQALGRGVIRNVLEQFNAVEQDFLFMLTAVYIRRGEIKGVLVSNIPKLHACEETVKFLVKQVVAIIGQLVC